MARQVITMLTDDLDGGAADESVNFALDGVIYEIDLSEKNASELRSFLERYVTAGARTGRVSATGAVYGSGGRRTGENRAPQSQSATANREQNQAIREWAVNNGFELAERGRIPQHIVDAYHRNGGRPLSVQETIPTLHEALAAPKPTVAEPAPKKTAPPAAKKAAPRKRTTAAKA